MNNRILALAALVLAVALFGAYTNRAWSGEVAETRAAIVSTDAAIAAAKKYRTREAELSKEKDSIDPTNLARLNTFLPDAVDNVGLILSLNAQAAKVGLAITSVDVSANSQLSTKDKTPFGLSASPVSSIDMSLSAVGKYSAFLSFLSSIERSTRLLDVHNISIAGAESGLYTYNMTVRLYWLR